jgi:hypothetical protein
MDPAATKLKFASKNKSDLIDICDFAGVRAYL